VGGALCKERLAGIVYPDGVGVWRDGDATVVFCLEYDRGTEQLGRLTKKAADYARLEEASGWAFWVLVVAPSPRREAGVRGALSGHGLAVATTASLALRPADAIWAPLGADGIRVRLAKLAGWPRPAESLARLARGDHYRQGRHDYEEEAS
jgi:hypothetical protein